MHNINHLFELLIHLIDHAALENIAEIIVVDGGSTDQTTTIVKNCGLNIKLLSTSIISILNLFIKNNF